MNVKYLTIIEKTSTGFSSYSPEVDGCVAIGATKKECEKNMREAIQYHIEFMLEKGYAVPKPKSSAAEFINVQFKKVNQTAALL
ncbi:MAG: type II toxin-antitoxin system HicB family antitoxin [Ignavibacteriae bacterium]|nr:type II toxin-antitoxin system HicB family antitoxin [Ignavibacteriota bacterium]